MWILAVSLALPWAAAAEIVVPGDRATLRWAPASGSVTGYEVRVARNGAAPLAEALVSGTEFTVVGAVGELVQVSVRAFILSSGPSFAWGPASPSSEPIRFAGTPSLVEGLAVLDCSTCGRIELRLLPAGTALLSVAHPSSGPWDLIRFGKFAAEGTGVQVALRQRTTGQLWIGDYDGTRLIRRARHTDSSFERSLARVADFNGDGLDEILVWDSGSGSLTFWGLVDGRLERIHTMGWVNSNWELVGIRDLDQDGQLDLWFDSHRGEVWVYFTYHFSGRGAVSILGSLSGASAMNVADYDGTGMPDVLWRDADGTLTLALLRGNPRAPQVELRELPRLEGDDLLTPRLSVDLDDRPGAEILLQTSNWGSGAVEMLRPGSVDPAQRQRLFTTAAGSKLVQVVR